MSKSPSGLVYLVVDGRNGDPTQGQHGLSSLSLTYTWAVRGPIHEVARGHLFTEEVAKVMTIEPYTSAWWGCAAPKVGLITGPQSRLSPSVDSSPSRHSPQESPPVLPAEDDPQMCQQGLDSPGLS